MPRDSNFRSMRLQGLRASWKLAALLVALLALPILGITAYFTVGVERLIAQAENERAGLLRIESYERFFADASAFAQAAACGKDKRSLTLIRARADSDEAQIEDRAIVSAWSVARTNPTAANLDAFFQTLRQSIIAISDGSGLTFDPVYYGIDLADSMMYRNFAALDHLQRVSRSLCFAPRMLDVNRRIALIRDEALAAQSLSDAEQDVSDVLARAPSNLELGPLSAAFRAAQRDASDASSRLDAFVRTRSATPDASGTARSLDGSIRSIYGLWLVQAPVMSQIIALRLIGYDRDRLVALLPGIIGLLAAVTVALLTMRLVYEQAAVAVAERNAAEHERIAMHDALTGLLNRRAFLGVLQRAIDTPDQGAVCLFDIDDFKGVNDTYGHLAGDDLLVAIARIIEAAVRSTDAVARLGGDEFAIFLHAPIDRQGVERVLGAIAREASSPQSLRGQRVQSSVSAGATMIDRRGIGVEDALAAADGALYGAKAHARGGFLFSDASQAAS